MFQVKGEILTDLAYYAHDNPGSDSINGIIEDKVQAFEDTINLILHTWEDELVAEAAERDAMTDSLTQVFEDQVAEKKGDLDQVVDLVGDYIRDAFNALKPAFCDVAEGLALQIAQFQADKLAIWRDRKEYELERARHTKDSYYRYHLLKLIFAKDSAIVAA